MLKNLENLRFYCRKCKKIVQVYEGYKEEKVFPELKPKFNIVTWCCKECHSPIIEVSELSKRRS